MLLFLLNLQKAVQASPKNRFAWHVWGVFEANLGNADVGRKLLKIGHAVNPRDPVLLQSLALLEYKYSTANLSRVLFRRASELDPRHQPVWIVRILSMSCRSIHLNKTQCSFLFYFLYFQAEILANYANHDSKYLILTALKKKSSQLQ